MAEEEPLHSLACAPEILDCGEAGADEVAEGFAGLVGNMDEGECTGAMEPGQRERVAAIGLHAIGGAQGDEGGADESAVDAAGAQMPTEREADRPGLADAADFGAVGSQATRVPGFTEGSRGPQPAGIGLRFPKPDPRKLGPSPTTFPAPSKPQGPGSNHPAVKYFRPNRISVAERVIHTALALALLGYGVHGLLSDDLYLPGKRRAGTHLHGTPALVLFLAIVCAASVLLSVVVDHYDIRDNERWYRAFARVAEVAGWTLFITALCLQGFAEMAR